MGCLLNILWHIPFLGFLFALSYAFFGLLMCCTVILIPVGLGWLQFARFLLSPFSCAMVSRSDLEKITGEKQNSAMAAFSLAVRILYFPFGCIAAVGMIVTIVLQFLSIVGIPCGLVWAKSLSTIFNPINKVCVPKAIGDEIERMKSAETVSKYSGQNPNAQVAASAVAESSAGEYEEKANDRPLVRTFDDDRLAEIVNNRDMYNAELVAQCIHEIDIRRKSESLSEKVAEFENSKLCEIMSSTGVYADELIYSCEKEYDRRAQLSREEMERAQEQARIEREKEAEEERIRRAEAEKAMREKAVKVLKIAAVVVPAIAAVCLVIYLCSDTHRYKSAVKLQEKGQVDKAVEKLSRIKDRSKYYEQAQYNLYLDYLELNDSIAAGAALVQAVRNGNWDVYEAYECYVNHFLDDDFPSDARSEHRVINLLEASPDPNYKIIGGELCFQTGQYEEAYRMLADHTTWSGKASGYIGIMYLYGLADLDINLETAYKYLMNAPNENPFLVHKGDLMLFLQKGDAWSFYRSIEMADPYYATAASAAPDNRAYADRHKIMQKIIAAKRKHDDISYWDRGKVYWDRYVFNNGSYDGEVMWYGGVCGAHGWGWFQFQNKELNIGTFSYCNNNGLNMRFIPRESGGYSVFVGEYKNNVPVSGSYVFDSGAVWSGKFKPSSKFFDLKDGVETDLNGNKLRDIKQ